MNEFEGSVVLVTGAGRNLGRSIALGFAAKGAILALNDINPDHVEMTADLAQQAGGKASTYVFDIAKRMPVEAMMNQILDDFGQVDILINNAAVHPRARLVDMDEWDWHRTLDVNLGGPFFTMQQAGRAMQASGGGVIVNLGISESTQRQLDRSVAYLASKAGLLALTHAAAREFEPFNIRVNAVCPHDYHSDSEPVEKFPLGWESAYYDQVTALVLNLCSAASAHISGKIIEVDFNPGASIKDASA